METVVTPERWQQVKTVLEEALALAPEDRSAYLDRACADDRSVREEVESFLTVTTEVLEDFLEAPAVGRPPAVPDNVLHTAEVPTRGCVDEVRPLDLAPYTKLRISTRSSEYRLTIVAPLDLDVIVQGGSRFPVATRAHLHRQDVIAVGRVLRLRVETRKVVTTPVTAIEVIA